VLAAAGIALRLLGWLVRLAALPVALGLRGVPVSPAAALLGAVAALAAACLGWLLLGAVAEALGHVPGALGRGASRVSATVTPRAVRRVIGVVLGVGMGLGVGAGPSVAAPARSAAVAVQDSAHRVVLAAARAQATAPTAGGDALPDPGWFPTPDPGWTPEAPTVRPQPDVSAVSPAGRRASAADPVGVVVRRGDSLWALAARHLGPGATDAEIAAEWPRWYTANRATIGPDPDLLLPGQVLRPPGEPR